jgi:hypothetical protein
MPLFILVLSVLVSLVGALIGRYGFGWLGLDAPWWAWALLALGCWLSVGIAFVFGQLGELESALGSVRGAVGRLKRRENLRDFEHEDEEEVEDEENEDAED